jgi:hypothetical protein
MSPNVRRGWGFGLAVSADRKTILYLGNKPSTGHDLIYLGMPLMASAA